MNSKWIALLREKRNDVSMNPDSILKKYDNFLNAHGIYFALDRMYFHKSIKGHTELCEGILDLYAEATLENEKLVLLEDLATIGYNTNKLSEMILHIFRDEPLPTNLWEYADLLYTLNNFRYLSEYLTIISNKRYGDARQMLILLVGKSKNKCVIPVLKELLNDSSVYGHALEALSNFREKEIEKIMCGYLSSNIIWIKQIAEKYLRRQE